MTKRPRGSGRYWKRRNGGWAIEYPKGDGTTAHESVARALGKPPALVTEREALKLLNHRLAEIATGEAIDPEHDRLTVRALIDRYLGNLRIRRGQAAVDGWRPSVAMLAPMHHVRAARLQGAMVDEWMAQMTADGYAAATVNTGVALLSAAYHYGRAQRLVRRAPEFTRYKLDNARRGFFGAHEAGPILDRLAVPYGDAARWLYLSGWRRGEVVAMAWAWVDRLGGVLTLPDTHSKNGEGRTIPLRHEDGTLNDLGALIETRWKARRLGVPHVFHRDGRPISGGMLHHAWAVACKAAGFWEPPSPDYPQGRPTRLLHDFRRTAVRDMVRAGVSESVAMTITGHKSRAIFSRYNITDERDRRLALSAVAEHRARLAQRQ